MINSSDFTMDMLSNPTKMATTIIDSMQASDTGGGIVINDPNNGFVMQLLASMAVFSKFSEKVDFVNSFFYPQRARSAAQLFPHLSEFDYVNLMASPATLPFVFALSRDWILQNAVYYDENYNRILIPETSYITMGGIIYSMYHPIEILVNRNTDAVTAYYEGSSKNTLNTLSSVKLIDVQSYTKDGINYFQIQFNMYQFERVIENYTVASEQGFIKTLTYDDQFYAVKVFNKDLKGNFVELEYSLTDSFYDYQTPTAVLTLLPDTNTVKVEIPQIYFDNKQISKSVKIEIYSTKGKVNYSLSPADVSGLRANFDTTSSQFAAPLAQMPTWVIIPATTEVAGGSNVMTYDQVREAVVKQRLYDRVAVTTPEIIEAGKKAGFDLSKVTDDLTERMYNASNILVDSKGMIIPTFSGNIKIAGNSLNGDPSTILNYSDGYYTILPTTTFVISSNGLTCVPMTDGQVASMGAMTNAKMVEELNKGTYVRQPFHITFLTNAKSPQALIYNLLSPEMTSLSFVSENAHSAPQLTVSTCVVNHLANGTGGYQIALGVTRSLNIELKDINSFDVILTARTKTGEFCYIPATYDSTNEYGVDIWLVQLATSYRITTDNAISIQMYDHDDIYTPVELRLDQSFDILTTFVRSFDPNIPIDQTLNAQLPVSLQAGNVVMAKQTMEVSLGRNLSKQIYCGINTSWGNDVYKTADETIFYKATAPVFQNNKAGVINTRYNSVSKNIEVVQLYAQGDTPSDTKDIELIVTSVVPLSSTGVTVSIFPVNSIAGLLVGMAVRGTNIPINAVITAIGVKSITLSKPVTVVVEKDTVITVTNPHPVLEVSVTQPAVGVQVSVASTAELIVGQSVFGFDIPKGSTIASINSATVFSLSAATTAALKAGELLTVINTTAPGVVKTKKGEIVSDPTGKPITIKSAQNQYLIPAILFDGRLFASNDAVDQEIVETISQRLQNFANQISTIDAGLIEDSNVFYKPARTMGFANFGVGGGQVINMSLELSFSFKVYVDESVYNTQTLLSTMSSSIVATVNKEIQKPIISVSSITEEVIKSLGTNVVAVEGGDISNMEGLRLISLQDQQSIPSIENLLSIQSDGRITRAPNVKISYLPKPDTSSVSVLTSL